MATNDMNYNDYISRPNGPDPIEISNGRTRPKDTVSSDSDFELSSLLESKEKRVDLDISSKSDAQDSVTSDSQCEDSYSEKSKLLKLCEEMDANRMPHDEMPSGVLGGRPHDSVLPKKTAGSPNFAFGTTNFSTMRSIREEGTDDEEEDIIMDTMDYLEDEIDGHTYDEVIPLQIRMALEDQIFGWDHFLSNILGHVGYTIGSYLVTFWTITFIVLREVPWEDDDARTPSNPWNMPRSIFSALRTAISLTSAITMFRTIRRRRRVWLRPFGKSSFLTATEAERRNALMEDADQRAKRFVLGSKLWTRMQKSYLRGRDGYLAQRVNRNLLKAQQRFERGHRNRFKLIRSSSNSSLLSDTDDKGDHERPIGSAPKRHGHGKSHHERVRMLASSGSKRFSDPDYTSGEDTPGSKGGSSDGHECYTVGEYNGYYTDHTKNSLTLPNFAMESVSQDQMPFAHGEIKNIPYVHGGFFGAAPFMLTNPHWIGILRVLMPDVYVEISKRASYAPAPKLIHWAENNPVVAAYGTAHELEFSGKVSTLEWDVFLDPHLVRRLEIVLNEKEVFLQKQREARRMPLETGESNSCGGEGVESGDDRVRYGPSQASSSANERLVMKYYDIEIWRRTAILVERMMIAHGNLPQLMIEQTGWLKKYNFSRIKRLRKTLGGGIFARQWLAIYSQAMKLGLRLDEYDESSDSEGEGRKLRDVLGSKRRSTERMQSTDSQCVSTKSINPPESVQSTHGPPKKIYMNRSNTVSEDDGEGTSTDGSTANKQSPNRLLRKRREKRTRRRRKMRRTSIPKRDVVTPTSLFQASICPDTTMHESISLLKQIMKCPAPFGVLLDMKSRHVSRRVWALVIDFLRDSGARVEGIASFFIEEVRDITQHCSSPVNEIFFFHSAGDMQLSCNRGLLKRGDRIFFNAGSLLWDYPNLNDSVEIRNIVMHRLHPCFDGELIKRGYRLKYYAEVSKHSDSNLKSCSDDESGTCDESTVGDVDSTSSDVFMRLLLADRHRKSSSDNADFFFEQPPNGGGSTIQDYKEHYQLSIGLYVQEFAIDEAAISLIVRYVNTNPHVYDLGLSWGGVNGLTVRGIQPGRFTATDGLWNQRYGGTSWRKDLQPCISTT